MTLSEAQVSRLPKAVQRELINLQNEINVLTQKLTAGPSGSDTFLRNGRDRPATPLGVGPRVSFIGVDGEIIVTTTGDGRIDVSTDGILKVQPQSGNRIIVTGGWDR